jgi:hypothetical protein
VIFIGDLVDRGPDSGKCLDLAMEFEAKQGIPSAILGNHEDVHLRYQLFESMAIRHQVRSKTHIETRKQLTAEHYLFMRRLPLMIQLPEYNAVVVHAGVFPGRPLSHQSRTHLLHIQMIRPDVDEETTWPGVLPDSKFWTHFWDGPERIIFGHSNLDKPLVTDKVVGIDGGVCFGGSLNALILPEWEIVSVPGLANHGKGSRGSSGKPIEKFVIHEDVSTYS